MQSNRFVHYTIDVNCVCNYDILKLTIFYGCPKRTHTQKWSFFKEGYELDRNHETASEN